MALLVWQARNLAQRPDLDRSGACPRYPTSDTDRGVKILGIDQEISCQLLARLDEWTVGDEWFAVADTNNRCAFRRL